MTPIFSQPFQPIADPAAVVAEGNARFTVLTPQVIRLEYAADARFEDHASLTFTDRRLPVPKFTTARRNGQLTIKTDRLELSYRIGSGEFSAANLQIRFDRDGRSVVWKPGTPDTGNLQGTTRTLDGFNGVDYHWHNEDYAMEMDPGLVSRNGWVLVDDSERPLFDDSDWPWVMPRPEKELQDWYFFAHGSDYKQALYDFTRIAGKIPMPPKYAFGVWWSRYWAYTDREFQELVEEYARHDLPLDVLVIDMDWHLTEDRDWYQNGLRQKDQAGERYGWTGFTWNPIFFPDPEGFLRWTDEQKLQTCLNLHPASGIQTHEAIYPEFARAMGMDPASGKYVPFNIVDKKYAQTYFDLLLHPYEEMGIDFWWLDWQQWSTTSLKGVNPTFYLNYVHFSDMERQNKVRPLLYHRWGGIGNHRYQIGFSGDTDINWPVLDYMPYFTATAANVGYAYWSHDIGGHHNGTLEDKKDPELYTRWVQFGAFSPIFRTHCTKDGDIERRMWTYPSEYFEAMRKAVHWRYSLFPYLYTEARKTHDSGTAFFRPLYYDFPGFSEAYDHSQEYLFGDDLLLAPITEKRAGALTIEQTIWLPPGRWIDWESGAVFEGGQTIRRPYTLDEIPVFAREGAIIPRQPKMHRIGEKAIDPLILQIFPGEEGGLRLYDDAGNDQGYLKQEYTFTPIRFTREGRKLTVTIEPMEGSFDGMVQDRAYEVRLPLTFPPEETRVNGQAVAYDRGGGPNTWHYDGTEFGPVVRTTRFPTTEKVVVELTLAEGNTDLLSNRKRQMKWLDEVSRRAAYYSRNWPLSPGYFLEELVELVQTGHRIELDPRPETIEAELAKLDAGIPRLIEVLRSDSESRFADLVAMLERM